MDVLFAPAVKFWIRLAAPIYEGLCAQAEAQGLDVGELAQRLLTTHTIDSKLVDHAIIEDVRLRRRLVERTVDIARRVMAETGMQRDIQCRVIMACEADEVWMTAYRLYVNADPFIHKNPKKSSLNKELGMRIHRALGGKVARSRTGKAIKTPVAGSVIQSYTKMLPDATEDQAA